MVQFVEEADVLFVRLGLGAVGCHTRPVSQCIKKTHCISQMFRKSSPRRSRHTIGMVPHSAPMGRANHS